MIAKYLVWNIYFMVNKIKIKQLKFNTYVVQQIQESLNSIIFFYFALIFFSFSANLVSHKIENDCSPLSISSTFLADGAPWRNCIFSFLKINLSARVPYVDLKNVFRFLACNRWSGGAVRPPLERSGNPMRAILCFPTSFP